MLTVCYKELEVRVDLSRPDLLRRFFDQVKDFLNRFLHHQALSIQLHARGPKELWTLLHCG